MGYEVYPATMVYRVVFCLMTSSSVVGGCILFQNY